MRVLFDWAGKTRSFKRRTHALMALASFNWHIEALSVVLALQATQVKSLVLVARAQQTMPPLVNSSTACEWKIASLIADFCTCGSSCQGAGRFLRTAVTMIH
jgi:hypothetical protein